jgi:uncharacterized protein (DUF58 family)
VEGPPIDTATLRQALADGERAGQRYALGLPRRAPAGPAGETLSNRAGSSLEFRDYRDYQPGDDLRHIDWNAFARSDQLSVKLFREEVTPHVDVVLDASRSMALEGTAKASAAVALAAFLTTAARNAGCSHAVWLLGGTLRQLGNSAALPVGWEPVALDQRGMPVDALTAGPRWRPRGFRFLISDLLWLGEPLSALRHLADRAAAAVVVQLLADADVNPPVGESLRLVDSETDEVRELFVDESVAVRYREALARHQENWHLACRQTGAIFTTVVAERLLDDWSLPGLVAADVLRWS